MQKQLYLYSLNDYDNHNDHQFQIQILVLNHDSHSRLNSNSRCNHDSDSRCSHDSDSRSNHDSDSRLIFVFAFKFWRRTAWLFIVTAWSAVNYHYELYYLLLLVSLRLDIADRHNFQKFPPVNIAIMIGITRYFSWIYLNLYLQCFIRFSSLSRFISFAFSPRPVALES